MDKIPKKLYTTNAASYGETFLLNNLTSRAKGLLFAMSTQQVLAPDGLEKAFGQELISSC